MLEATCTINRDHRKSTCTHVLSLVNTFGINKHFFLSNQKVLEDRCHMIMAYIKISKG